MVFHKVSELKIIEFKEKFSQCIVVLAQRVVKYVISFSFYQVNI